MWWKLHQNDPLHYNIYLTPQKSAKTKKNASISKQQRAKAIARNQFQYCLHCPPRLVHQQVFSKTWEGQSHSTESVGLKGTLQKKNKLAWYPFQQRQWSLVKIYSTEINTVDHKQTINKSYTVHMS